MRFPWSPLVLTLIAFGCSSSSSSSNPHPGGTNDAGSGTGTGQGGTRPDSGVGPGKDAGSGSGSGTSAGTGTGSADAASDAKGDAPVGATTIRVHYPAGSSTLTLRGSLAPLSWTADTTLTAGGTDTWTLTIPSLSGPLELKPRLGTTWAVGPNYHVLPGQSLDLYPHFTATAGQVVTLISAFQSTVLSDTRAIYAYLPASYMENTDATYPVVYMHDGQNLWAALSSLAFATPWNVDTTFDTASNQGACSAAGVVGWGQPLGGTAVTCNADGDCPSGECRTFPEAIVIGVANDANRIYEYTPTTDPSTPGGGGADLYLQMLVMELKPAIDGMLRTRPDVASTAMAGSSLGGLVTAYAGLKYPNVYGQIAALSPSTWWNSDVIVTDIMATLAAPHRPLIVYVDSGSGTTDDESDTDELAAEYLTLGYVAGQNFRHVIQTGAQHSEVYWAERFPGAMQLVLGAR